MTRTDEYERRKEQNTRKWQEVELKYPNRIFVGRKLFADMIMLEEFNNKVLYHDTLNGELVRYTCRNWNGTMSPLYMRYGVRVRFHKQQSAPYVEYKDINGNATVGRMERRLTDMDVPHIILNVYGKVNHKILVMPWSSDELP